MGVPGPGAWPRILAGTRACGLAPLDLLLVAALVATAAQGTWARLTAGDGTCRGVMGQPLTPFVSFHDGTQVSTFQYADLALPLGVPIDYIAASPMPSASFALDDGALHPGDRLLRVGRWGTVWGRGASLRVSGGGAWLATGWTFVVLHGRTTRTYHLAVPCW